MVQKRKNEKNKRSAKTSPASHLKASLTYVAAHKHTGQRLHNRHTSHGFLLILLIVAGIILFISLASLRAAGVSSSGNINVTFTVPGPAPITGAVMTSVANKSKVSKPLLEIEGTCPSGTIVAIYNNGSSVGSTTCTPTGTFLVTIQLYPGINTLQAQNYDNLNQAGPITAQIQVEYDPEITPAPQVVNTLNDIVIDPSIPDILAPLPSENPCYNLLDTGATTELSLVVPCVIQNVYIGEKITLPFLIVGGIGPYAVSADWGDGGVAQLFSFPDSGRKILTHTFTIPNTKAIVFNVADAKGQVYHIQSTVTVHDNSVAAISGDTPFQSAINSISAFWLDASVPVYWAAVSLFGGFWIGELFQRFLGAKKLLHRRT